MSNKEFRRHIGYASAKSQHPAKWNLRPSRRSVKGNGRGVGQVLLNSRVRAQVPLDKIFPSYK